MNRFLIFALIGAALVTQAALASDSFAEAGRYQLIPRVSVPNQTAKAREQPILLDTRTGRTWRLVQDAKDAKGGKTNGAHWVPLDPKFAERFHAGDASRGSGKKVAKRRAFGAKPNYAGRKQRLDEFYDDDP